MSPPPRTATRVLLLAAAVGFAALLLTAGFPPGSPDRLPVFVAAVGLAVIAAASPPRGTALFAFLFPCAGLLARLSGGTEPATWPGLLLSGFLAGWCFRFLYDFESRPQPAPPDGPLRALAVVWALSTLVAAARAVTLWAAVRGLVGRAVNGEGLTDGIALRETLFAFAALAGGAAFYFVLRRSGEAVRRRAVSAALVGIAVSAAAAVLQRAGVLAGEARPYWRALGRLSGGAVDPNSLGLLCGLGVVVALYRTLSARRRGPAAVLLSVLAAGLALSGSRSGVAVAGLGSLLLVFAPALSARAKAAAAAILALAAAAAVAVAILGGGGSAGARIAQTFDPRLPQEYRMSARPLLWRAAGRLFLEHPIAGAGMGAFAWRFPDLLAEERRTLPTRDNPGSGYVQALAETGAIGFLLTAAAAVAIAAAGWRRLRSGSAPTAGALPAADGPASGTATIAFLVALAAGSHWLAPDVALLFFLLAADAASPLSEAQGPLVRRLLAAAVALYAVAAAAAILTTSNPEETFRYSRRIGFHDLERGPGGAFRWTRQRFALLVAPGDPPLRLGLANFGPVGQPVTVTASVSGSPVLRRTLAPGQATACRLFAGRAPGAVVFTLDKSFVPRRLGVSSDRRRLGLLSISSAENGAP